MSEQQVTEGENLCINCASRWTPKVSADARLIAKYVSSIDEGVGALVNGQRALIEAVRSLKPAPTVSAISATEVDAWQTVEQLRKKLECVRVQSEARGDNLRRAQDEIDRMNQVIADQALTIGTLKDESARLRAENAALAEKQCALMEANRAISIEQIAELKRFREREEKVLELVRLADDYAGDTLSAQEHPLWDAIEAVRDFKVNT